VTLPGTKKLFALLGAAIQLKRGGSHAAQGFTPYTDVACNRQYNLLFFDQRELLQSDNENAQGVLPTLLAAKPSAAELNRIADDVTQESRVRYLAFARLREFGCAVPEKQLLGTIIEVGLPRGLDVLAVYADARVRYIGPTESLAVIDPAPQEWTVELRRLTTAARAVIEQIGPWEHARIAPPAEGMIRMSFLVSDGLYFGQGLLTAMADDPMAQPIMAARGALLTRLAAHPTSNHHKA